MSRPLTRILPDLLIMPGRKNRGTIALVLLAASAAAGAASFPDKTFELAIASGAIAAEQRALRVNKGDTVRLRVTSDAPGEIHLHGYRLEAKLAPGVPAEINFKAHATGRYRLEWHPAGAPFKAGSHHGPAPATLDVRPR